MNIIFFSNSTWSIYNFRRNFLRSFIRKGYKVYIISNKDHTTKFVKEIGCKFIDLNFDTLKKNIFIELQNIFKIIKVIKKINPKIIYSFTLKPNLYSALISFFYNYKVINTFDGLGRLYDKKNFFSFLYILILKTFNKNIIKIFLVNKSNYDLFKKKKVINRNKLKLIKAGTGIDVKFYKYSKIKNKKNFLFLGRYLPSKGVIEFCEVAKDLKKIRSDLNFISAGNYYDEDKSLISKSELNKFKKYVDFHFNVEDVRYLIRKSTCVVLPSYYNEGLNRSLMEALSMGRPIITCNTPGCRELLNYGKNGFKIVPRSKNSLKKQIILFSNLKQNIIERMSKNCRKFIVKNFSDKKIINEYLKILKQ